MRGSWLWIKREHSDCTYGRFRPEKFGAVTCLPDLTAYFQAAGRRYRASGGRKPSVTLSVRITSYARPRRSSAVTFRPRA